MLDLQRTVGNAAVASLVVQRKGGSMLRLGSTGQDVLELQSALNHTDEVVTPLAVDGIFGPVTDKAVRQFQAAHPPLVADGVVGPLTRAAIDDAGTQSQDDVAVGRKLFERGAAAYAKKKYAHAYDFFTRAYELTQRLGLVFSRAQALRNLGGRADEAVALYEQYIAEGGPRSAEAAAHVKEMKGPEATGDQPTDTAAAKALFTKGAALFGAGDYAHAYDEMTKAYRLDQRPGLIFSRAQCLRKLGGRSEEAIALYEQYIAEGAERSAEAAAHIAELRGPEATGDPETDTAMAKALFTKGAALFGAGDYAHAYDEMTKAYKLDQRPGLIFSRAQCLRKLGGRREDAIALYEQYISEGGGRAREAQFYAKELRTQGAAP